MKAFFENQHNYETIPFSVMISDNLNFLPHWHVEVEMILVLDGMIEMGINTERKRLHPGDFAVSFSNDIHSYTTAEESSVILIKFLPEFVDGTGMWQKNHRLLYPFISNSAYAKTMLCKDIHGEMTRLIHGILNEERLQADCYTWMIKGKLLELCAILLRHLPKAHADQESKHAQSVSGIRLVRAALQYIEENCTRNITLDEISKRMNLSPYYFSRLFNQVTGMNLKSYQNLLRLNKAESMILGENAPITEIAFECGFNSLRTFNRWFRLMKGFSPSELRKNHTYP